MAVPLASEPIGRGFQPMAAAVTVLSGDGGEGVKMGGVKLEIFRMCLYLSFPVTVFWISNQAEYFEEYVIKRKREIYPPEEKMRRKELEDFKERMREKREQKLLRALETQKTQEQ